MSDDRLPNEAAVHPHHYGPFDQARTLRLNVSAEQFTTLGEEASQRQAHKNWHTIGKKEHERFVSTLITLSRHAIVAGIARATPATEPSEQCAR